jgi:hypothetical protein
LLEVPGFEVVDEVLFEICTEVAEYDLYLSPFIGVDHPEVEFGGRGVLDPIGGEDTSEALDQVGSACSRFADQGNVINWLDCQMLEPADKPS